MPEFSNYVEALGAAATAQSVLIPVSQGGNPKSITEDQLNHFRGAYDLSVNAYPSSGGTGASGVPGVGDYWYVSVAGAVDVFGLGTITLERGALLIYIGGTVTSSSSWIVKQ